MLCGLTFCGTTLAQAQGLTVTTITVDGKPSQSVANVQVRVAGAASGQAQTLKAGVAIAPGTELTLPRGARIALTSSNGNTITLHPGARFQAGVVTARGESHQPLGGRVDFHVRKALDFFNIQYDRITASVKGTDYRVEIDPAKSLKLSVTQGVVEVQREVQIRFAASAGGSTDADATTGGQSRGIRIAEELKAGQSKTYPLNVAEYLVEFKNFGEAETYFRNALSAAEATGDKHRVLRAVVNLSVAYWRVGKPKAMLELESRCIALAQDIASRASEAACLRLSGLAYLMLGEYRRSIEYHEKALALNERLYAGRDRSATATNLSNLGVSYSALGDYRKAIDYHEKALAMRERVYARRDHADIAYSYNNLGHAYNGLGEHRAAIEYHDKALAMHERVFGRRDHPDTAFRFHHLGRAYNALGNHRKAIEYHDKALAIRQRIYARRDHPEIASSFNHLGRAYSALGEQRKAIDYLKRALAMRERVFGGNAHPDIVQALRDLANAHDKTANATDAARYRERADAMQRRLGQK